MKMRNGYIVGISLFLIFSMTFCSKDILPLVNDEYYEPAIDCK